MAPLSKMAPSRKLVLLKLLSLATAIFLVVAGVIGACSVIFGGGFVYFIGSLYTIFFGLLVVVVEVKDKTAPVSAAYDWLHVYLKFLTFQRGKGTFYLGVGLLLFFIGPACTSFCIGVVNLAAMCLIAVGLLHTIRLIKEESSTVGVVDDSGMLPPAGTPAYPVASQSTWGSMVEQSQTAQQKV
mmetsp:Transcript_806/g.1457  ORF Transcript_806/g.1457 Transcript_806/m.1457 type:complete len:184 (-) Transcript_806:25-576(-)